MLVIIGATRGLGREIALRAAGWDTDLMLCARESGELEQVRSDLSLNTSSQIHVEPLDLSSPASIDRLVDRLVAAGEPLRGIIICAAGYYKGPLLSETDESIDSLIGTTFAGPVRLITKLLRSATLQTPFDVVDITSVGAATDLDSSRSSVMHIVTKAALHLFGVCSGKELASKGIRIASIAPGTFAKGERPGIPRASVVDFVELTIALPVSTYVESIVLRPTGFDKAN